MEVNNLSEVEFKTLVIRMLNELSEDLSSIKKIQSEMKDTKKNLQGKNSRVDEAKYQDLECEEPKSNQSEQQEGKRIQKLPQG